MEPSPETLPGFLAVSSCDPELYKVLELVVTAHPISKGFMYFAKQIFLQMEHP